MRTAAMLAAVVAIAPAAVAQEPQSAGATDWYGRGIVRIQQEGTEVRLDLKTEAQGMLLRLVEGQPIAVVAVGPFAAGESVVRIPPQPGPERVRVTEGHAPGDAEVAAAQAAAERESAHCMAVEAERNRIDPSRATPTRGGASYSTSSCGNGVALTTQRAVRSTTILRAAPREYLLLVVCDQPIDTAIARRIGTIPGFDPATAAHDLPEFLVGRRSPMWAGYLARR